MSVEGRSEDIWLSAESLERQLIESGALGSVAAAASNLVIAARELYELIAVPVETTENR